MSVEQFNIESIKYIVSLTILSVLITDTWWKAVLTFFVILYVLRKSIFTFFDAQIAK